MPYRSDLTVSPDAEALTKHRLCPLLTLRASRTGIAIGRFLHKQISRGNFQDRGKGSDHIDGRTINASLKRADICPINTSLMRKRLLRQSLCMSQHSEVARKNLTNVHIRSHARRGAFIYGVNSTICRLRHDRRVAGTTLSQSIIRPVRRQPTRVSGDARNWLHGSSIYQPGRYSISGGSIAK